MPLSPLRFDELLVEWLVKFEDKSACAEAAATYLRTATAPDERRFNRWMQVALDKDQLAHKATDMLAEAHASTFELSAERIEQEIAAGNLHDFRLDLPVHKHEVVCPRCQIGIASRLRADEIAEKLGKKPFPSLGSLLNRVRSP